MNPITRVQKATPRLLLRLSEEYLDGVLMVDGLKNTKFSSSKIFFCVFVGTGRYPESGVISLGVGRAVGAWVGGTGGLYSYKSV